MTEADKDKEALWPTNQDVDAHNDKIATMLELVQRNQQLKERVLKYEVVLDAIKYIASSRGLDSQGTYDAVLEDIEDRCYEALKGE